MFSLVNQQKYERSAKTLNKFDGVPVMAVLLLFFNRDFMTVMICHDEIRPSSGRQQDMGKSWTSMAARGLWQDESHSQGELSVTKSGMDPDTRPG